MLARLDDLPNFQDISTDQYNLTDDDHWKTFFLYGYGFRSDANCRRCPETDRLVRTIPGMETAMFSIFAPHKRIPPHDGPYKGVVRYHLGLRVPADPDLAGIRVGDQTRHWREGGWNGLAGDPAYGGQGMPALLDTLVMEMVFSFRPTRMKLFRVMILPAVLPDILTAWKVNLGNASRVVVVAELVGATGGVGYELLQQQQLFDMAGALAWTLQLVFFVLIAQAILTLIENIAFRYRAVSERAI